MTSVSRPANTRTRGRKSAVRKPAARKPAAEPAAKPRKKSASGLKTAVVAALKDMKALDIKVLDVRELTDVADHMVIASGRSDRHLRSIAERVVEKCRQAGFRAHGIEGRNDSEWVLIDLSDIIVHVMLPRTREFYALEKLWDVAAARRAAVRTPG